MPTDQTPVLLEFARVSLMSLAFVVALYAFFAKEPRLREGAERLLLVIFIVGVSALLAIVSLMGTLNEWAYVAKWSANAAMVVFSLGWGVLLLSFWRLYGRLYHMREKRFWKYVAPFSSAYGLLSKRYVLDALPRKAFALPPYTFEKKESATIMNGYTIFLLGAKEVDLTRIAIHILVDGLRHGETGDYVCCHRPPDQIWREITTYYPDVLTATVKPAFIDAYSPNFGFDDEILKEKLAHLTARAGGYSVDVIPARTIPGIHTAGNTSWYISKKKAHGAGPRRPHRTVYDHLSALVPFSSVEQITNFVHHFMAGEKAYGMITVVIEMKDSPREVINTIYKLADCVIEFEVEAGTTYASMKKGKYLDLMRHTDKREYVFSS